MKKEIGRSVRYIKRFVVSVNSFVLSPVWSRTYAKTSSTLDARYLSVRPRFKYYLSSAFLSGIKASTIAVLVRPCLAPNRSLLSQGGLPNPGPLLRPQAQPPLAARVPAPNYRSLISLPFSILPSSPERPVLNEMCTRTASLACYI